MISEHWAILAALLPLAGFGSYIRDTLRARTQPNRVSWAIWAAAPLIAFPAELTAHAPPEIALVTLALGLGPLLVLIASVANRGAYWQLTRFDLLCGSVSVLALALWAVTRRGDVAVLFSIAADALAAAPTVRKSWSHPKSESCWTYVASGAGGGLTLLTVRHWTIASCGFPLYVVAVCGIIAVLVARPTPGPKPPARPQARAALRARPLPDVPGPARAGTGRRKAIAASIAAVPVLGALGVAGFDIATGIPVHGAPAVVPVGQQGLPYFHDLGTPQLRPQGRPAPDPLSQAPLPPTRQAPSAWPKPRPSRSRSPSPSPRPSPSPSPTRRPTPTPSQTPSPSPTSPSPSPTSPSPSPTSPSPSPMSPSPSPMSPSPSPTSPRPR